MAEFSLGLTKTAVEGTLSLVKSAVEEEKKLRDKVQNDLVFISGELEMMQSFLHDAKNNKQNDDKAVRLTLVRQLRTLAFDVEDCVEYVVHLDLDKSSPWGLLRRLWHTVNSCCAPPLPLDEAVDEIKQLKARVEDVCQRNTRYNLILHGSGNGDNNKQQLATVVPEADASTYPSPVPFHMLRDAWKATGRWRRNMYNLQQELLIAREGEDDHGLRVISVWGSRSTGGGGGGGGGGDGGDLWRASILTKVYCDPEISKIFKICAWVKLMHPFNHDEFVKSLLAQIYASSSHQVNEAGVDFISSDTTLMKTELMEQMKGQRYLVVLEDVFAVAEWDVIRMYLPDSNNGSRILLSTPELGVALRCTGEPYQVSELRKFPAGDNRFLCAFFKDKMRMHMARFYRQLRRRGVTSAWGTDDDHKPNLINLLYKGIINGWLKEIEGKSDILWKPMMRGVFGRVPFAQHSWVDVPHPFDSKVFAQRLFLNFHSDDIRASEIRKGGIMGEAELIEWCRESLFEKEDCLVVINGLQSMDDWDSIESNFLLSSSSSEAKAGCSILVITKEETVATQCVKDHEYQAFKLKDLWLGLSTQAYGTEGKKGRLFYDRSKDAGTWTFKFGKFVIGTNNPPNEGKDEEFGVFMLDDGSTPFVSDKTEEILSRGILRHAYYGAFQQMKRRAWVDVPCPFNLTDFSWRLLLDFYSDDPQAKEAVAVSLMKGILDPIQKCLEILRHEKCLVVICGLRLLSLQEWDSINRAFFSEHHKSIIIVDKTYGIKQAKVLQLVNQQRFTDTFRKEYRRKARKCTQEFETVGREREFHHLSNSLRHANAGERGLLSVWGIPGVDKSSIVKAVCYNQMPLYDLFGWVDVPNPFNLTEFAWHLLVDLCSHDPQAKLTVTVSMMEQGQDPIQECCNILKEKGCFLVINGLRSTQDWDLIKDTMPAIMKSCIIIVITDEEQVAMHCVQNQKDQVINIRRLEADVALNLLEKVLHFEGNRTTSEAMEEYKPIVPKCGGLPNVIAAIGEACRSARLRLLEPLNDDFMGALERRSEFHGLRPLFSWMRSYFDACSDSLKPCIFYLSIFSAEENIRWRRLLWRWIAEGYCRDTSNDTTCEENGAKYISELINLSIIHKSASNEVFCQINGFFHEYIISRPMEDNLVFALDERCSLNSTRAGQHLTIRSKWDRKDRIVYESIDFSRLRSLTVFGEWEPFLICKKKVNMRLLRVLDLEDATHVSNEDLDQIAKRLPRLKFLSLRGHTKITCLPSSVGGLRQLQTLDIRHTSIVRLPLAITKLHKLRYIRAGTSDQVWDWEDGGEEDRASLSATAQEGDIDAGSFLSSCNNRARTLVSNLLSSKLCRRDGLDGIKVPAGIQKLAALHTLGVINVNGSGAKSFFEELKMLTQLRKLGVSGINKRNIKEFFHAISGLAHLKSLSLEVVEKEEDDLDDGGNSVELAEPPKTLNSLKLYGHANKLLLDWVKKIKFLELKKLKVDHTIVKPEQWQSLLLNQRCPITRHLQIRCIQDSEPLHIHCIFAFADVVEIWCNSVFDIHIDESNAPWQVKVLKIHFSGGSRSSLNISGMSHFRDLQEVWLKGYNDAHKQDMQEQIAMIELEEGQKRPVLKLVKPRSRSS